MFAKQAQIAVAALALSIAGGAFAQSAERNVFDTETNLRMPAAASAEGLTREAVQAQYIAKRDAKGISDFAPHAWYFAQNNDSAPALVALLSNKSAQADRTASLSRDDVRAELAAARASGDMNVFDTETNLRVAPATARNTPTTVAQR